MEETTMQNEALRTRIHAEHLRKRLLSRNNGIVFREILSQISDADLVKESEQHHARQVVFAREDAASD
jgi:hypothetical protein